MDGIDTADVFMVEEQPLVQVEDEFGSSFFILLRNFALNSNALRQQHVDILREWVVPYISKRVGFAEIYGMTDRSGSKAVNYAVSGERVKSVQRSLLQLGAPMEKVHHRFAVGLGEDFFENRLILQGNDRIFGDSKQNSAFRLVAIALSPAPIGIPTRIFRGATARDTVSFGRLFAGRMGHSVAAQGR